MTDIFISYANEDRERAAQMAALLESAGWSVWWDRRIPAGRTWRKVLEDALVGTRCMVVLWSRHSVASPWVAEEAEEARRLEKNLLPVLIDAVEPPIGFRMIQAADLSRWDGSPDHPSARVLVADLRSLLGGAGEALASSGQAGAPQNTARDGFLRGLKLHWRKAALGSGVVVAGLLLALQLLSQSGEEAGEPKVAEPARAPALTRLAVSGQRNRIKPSEKIRLTARGQYSDGSQGELRTGVEWVSSDTAIAVVDEDGEVTGLKTGSATIVAKVGALESAEWKLGVESPEPAVKAGPRIIALAITPNKKELLVSEKLSLRVRAIYSDRTEKSVSSGVEWRVSDDSLAALNERGDFMARRAGKVEVVARAENISSAPQTLWIKERPAEIVRPSRGAEPSESPPAKPQVVSEPAAARIAVHVSRAQAYRQQGNYVAALAELEKGKALDARNETLLREIDQTKRACNAEKVLGNPVQCF